MTFRAAVVLAVLTSGCGAVRFDVDSRIPEQRVQGNPLGGLLGSFIANPFELDVDLQAETEKRGTGPATSAFIKSIALTATPHSAPQGNFDFLDELHIQIAATGLEKKEIAFVKPVPKGKTTLELSIVPEVNVLPYVNAGATISGQASGRQPSSDFTFDGLLVVDVRI